MTEIGSKVYDSKKDAIDSKMFVRQQQFQKDFLSKMAPSGHCEYGKIILK